jgi:hypothetical protein
MDTYYDPQRVLELFSDMHDFTIDDLVEGIDYMPFNTHQGYVNPFAGRKHTEETKAIMSQKHLGFKHTEKTKAKISAKWNDDRRESMSQCNKRRIDNGTHAFLDPSKREATEINAARAISHNKTPLMREVARQNAIARNKLRATCPHCGKEGQKVAMTNHIKKCYAASKTSCT